MPPRKKHYTRESIKIGWYGWYDLLKPLSSKAFSIPTIKKKVGIRLVWVGMIVNNI